ncbi:MAG: maleylpyruvate isomerase family mycothiol-dependent enzyme [Marmoricola sp.]
MTTTSPPPADLAPRRPRLRHREAMKLAGTEYDRVAHALAGLSPGDWARRTDCPDWDVRQLACHVVGMAAMASSPRETARQQSEARREHAVRGGPMVDSLTAIQVRERRTRTPEQVVAEARTMARKATRGRRLTPSFIRRRPFAGPQLVNGVEERWTVGYLVDVILTRDCWMHRVDIARACATKPELTADHDGVVVADVVREWAERHGRPYRLELTGPAGGHWSSDGPGAAESIQMDAVEFCRTLSGRETGVGLLSTEVPF